MPGYFMHINIASGWTEPRKWRWCLETATLSTCDFTVSIILFLLTDESHSGSRVGQFIPHSCLNDCIMYEQLKVWQTEAWNKIQGEILEIAKNPNKCHVAVSGSAAQGFISTPGHCGVAAKWLTE